MAPLEAVGEELEHTIYTFKAMGIKKLGRPLQSTITPVSITISHVLDGWEDVVQGQVTTDGLKQQALVNHFLKSPFCAEFSGDYPDLAGDNIVALHEMVENLMEDIRDKSKGVFDRMYNGTFVGENQESLTVYMMKQVKWTGKESIMESLDQATTKRVKYAIPCCRIHLP